MIVEDNLISIKILLAFILFVLCLIFLRLGGVF